MDYLDLLVKFWDFNNHKKLAPIEVTLYLYILHKSKINSLTKVQISDTEISKDLSVSKKTIFNARKSIIKEKLVMVERKKGFSSIYSILDLDTSLPITSSSKIQSLENTEKIKENKPNGKKEIPSLEEFMNYAKTVEIYDSTMDFQIKIKYQSWIDNDWNNGYNKPIINWRIALKTAMSYMKKASMPQNNIFNTPSIRRPKTTYNE